MIIYGFGQYGKAVYRVLKEKGIKVTAIVDKKQPAVDSDIPVFTIDTLPNEFISEQIAICIFNDSIANVVKDELIIKGFTNFVDSQELLIEFSQKYKKKCLVKKGDEFKIRFLQLIVTEYCTLNCRDCGHFISCREEKKHFEINALLKSVDKLLLAVERIEVLTLLGGEVFIYPDLLPLMRELVNRKKIDKIVFNTNGTVVPSDDFFDIVAKAGNVTLIMSDYGKLNTKKTQFFEKCKEYNISIQMSFSDKCWEVPTTCSFNRTHEQNFRLYAGCTATEYSAILYDDKLFPCVKAYTGYANHYIPMDIIRHDWVDIDSDSPVNDAWIDDLKRFSICADGVQSCDYCITEPTFVERAIQI